MTKLYELVVLLHPDLEIDAEAAISKIEKLIEAVGGSVTKRDNWGKKRLAYKVAKHDFAVYVYFEAQIEAESVRELDRTLLITEEVIRHIIVVHEDNHTRGPVKPAKPAKAAKVETEAPKAAAVAEEN